MRRALTVTLLVALCVACHRGDSYDRAAFCNIIRTSDEFHPLDIESFARGVVLYDRVAKVAPKRVQADLALAREYLAEGADNQGRISNAMAAKRATISAAADRIGAVVKDECGFDIGMIGS